MDAGGVIALIKALGGGGSSGYEVETETVSIIPEQTVSVTPGIPVSTAGLTLAEGIDAPPESLTVVLNDVEHTTTAADQGGGRKYMADDESFFVQIGTNPISGDLQAFIVGSSLPESITVEAYNKETTVTVSDEFKAAVAAAGGGTFFIGIESDGNGYTMSETWTAIMAASSAGMFLVGVLRGGATSIAYFPIIGVFAGEDSYAVRTLGYDENSQYGPLEFMTDDENGYPAYGGIA